MVVDSATGQGDRDGAGPSDGRAGTLPARGERTVAEDSGGLVAGEGVDEGSADSTQEAAAPPPPQEDLLGEPPRGAPSDDAQAAAPVDMETGEARAARAERGPGQQVQEGEG